ncbi:hypothetical protein QUA71_02710 [Microcoleus sp. MON1_C5]
MGWGQKFTTPARIAIVQETTMLLYKIEDFNPNYRQAAFDDDDIKGLDV